jgi:8-oxo-dGTP diphosphatase
LEQLRAFGDPGRDPRGWTISIAHLAVVDEAELQGWRLQAGSDAGELAWFDLGNPPALAFDHDEILGCAAERLAGKLES